MIGGVCPPPGLLAAADRDFALESAYVAALVTQASAALGQGDDPTRAWALVADGLDEESAGLDPALVRDQLIGMLAAASVRLAQRQTCAATAPCWA